MVGLTTGQIGQLRLYDDCPYIPITRLLPVPRFECVTLKSSVFPRLAMPIYAYKCASCGFAKDVLQKISDPLLTVCPQCGQSSFAKQLTAAGFQLKGSGWYATDFRGGGSAAKEPPAPCAEGAPDGGAACAGCPAAVASAPSAGAAAD
jgi:putative FmdB family regulatory protein